MDEDDQSLHPVQILIDELKNDDMELRLNSMRSLGKIAEALGQERTKTELVPFLSTSAVDDEDEVLVVLAEQLGHFPKYVGEDYSFVLIPPLEKLSTLEDSNVRDQAVKSLTQICNVLSTENCVTHLLPVVERLALGEWFTNRVSSCILFPVLLAKIPPQFHERIFTLYLKLCKDDTPMVRRECCSQLKNLAQHADIDSLKRILIPKFVELSKDDQDSVRLLAVETAVAIAKRLSQEENIVLVLGTVLECANDKSWRVRYMVGDLFCKLCEAFGPQITTDHLATAFIKIIKDPEAEVRTVAAANVAGVCAYVPREFALNDVIPSTKDLVSDSSQYVRVSFAKVIMDLAPICGQENTNALLLDLFLQLLKDEFPDVRLSIISKLGAVNKVISVELLEQSLLPAIVHLAEDKQWRVRLAIIEHIPALAGQLGMSYFNDKLGDLCFSWLNDPVYSIREAATTNLKKLSELFGSEWTEKTLMPRILTLRSSQNYLYRLTALFSIRELTNSVSTNVLEASMLPLVIDLADDLVPNVRFNVAKTLDFIYTYLTDVGRGQATPCLKKLQNDSDNDVRYYASIALHHTSALNV